ncbi:MAG TPA: prepilin-type N-terminal cleavage/methylation domain-containing protein [Candidatus Paceibacterota bacterium]|nr:prepilin-type N-terminal cleavage/methylation domain-containing protein [Candidatus Paceibacterota bacterium]
MKTDAQRGFSLIELLVAAAVFTYVVASIGGLFVTAINIQRRATGVQKIEENAQFALESIAREVRVSTVTSGDTDCNPVDPVATATLTIQHPVNGAVTYRYDRSSGVGILYRNDQAITSSDVDVASFAFCVSGSGHDGHQTRVTMPVTIQSLGGSPSTRVTVSLQTTVTSRDLTTDLK